MGGWLVLIAFSALGADQADSPDVAPVSQEAILRALEQLGAPQYSVRRHASRFLWQQGLAAESALQRAAQEPDREIRLRAQLILDDFRYGILPDVPDEVNMLIRQFRDGDTTQRLASLQALADRDDFERLQRLIRLEPDGNTRGTLLVYLMGNPRAVEHFLQLDRLEELIAAVGVDQDAAWRQSTLAQMLFSETMIRRLSERDNLQVLAKVVQREPSADVRREMLSRLFENAAAVAALIEQRQFDLVLKLIEMEPQQRSRSQWIVQMVAMPQAVKQLVELAQLDRFLTFARENAEPEQQATILQRAVQHPDVVQAIMKKDGVDSLVELSAVEADPAARGKLLASIVASAGVRQALNQDGQRDLILQLAAKQQPALMHNEFMKGILTSGYGYSLFQQADSRKRMWNLIKTESSETDLSQKDWRGEAIFRLLTMSGGEEIFRDESELKWLLAFLDDQVTDDQRLRLVQRVLSDHRLQRVMNGVQYFEPLLALIQRIPDNQRGALLGRLIALTTVERLVEASQIQRVITLAREEASAEARRAYLENLFRNIAVMTSLVANGLYDDLWQLVVDESDAVTHAVLRGDFYSTPAVIVRLQEQDQIDTLVEFARQQTDAEARRGYLVRLFRNLQAMTLLVDRNHYEALYEMARRETDEDERATLLSVFYVSPRVLQRQVADKQLLQVLTFAEQHLSGNDQRNFLQQICQQETTVAAIVEQQQLDRVIGLIKLQGQEHHQAVLMRMVLASPRVVEHYGTKGKLSDLFTTISGISINTRHQIWDSLLQRVENVRVILKHDGLEDLLARIAEEPQATRRGMLIGRLLAHQPVIEHWIASKGLASIFDLIQAEGDAQSRQYVLRTLFGSESAIGALLLAGAFDELYDAALLERNEQQRSQLLAQLLTNPKMVKHLVSANRVDRLIQVAGQQSDVEIRRQVLSQILTSHAAVEALVEEGHLDQLLKLCRLDNEASSRRQLLITLLETRRAIDGLAEAEQLESMIREILGETDEDSRRSFVQSLLSRREMLPVLIDRGIFGEVLKVADAEGDADERRQLLLPLLYQATAARELARLGRMTEMIQLVSDEIEASGTGQVVAGLLANPAVLQALVVNGGCEAVLDWVERDEDHSRRGQLLAAFWNAPSSLAYLIEHGHFVRLRRLFDSDKESSRRQAIQHLLYHTAPHTTLKYPEVAEWLVELLRAEPETSTRQSYAMALLNNSQIRQHLVSHGHAEFLREAVTWIQDEFQRRQHLRDLIHTPSGLVAFHLIRGEHQQAERLLEEHALDDLGRLRSASYWWAIGRIDEQLDAVQRRYQQDAAPGDARQLVYLHRVRGDLDSAYRFAQPLDDAGLQKALLVEMRRWTEAAALQEADPCPLPIPWTNTAGTPPAHLLIEQQGLAAAYHRLAGDRAAFDRTVARLVETAASHPEDRSLQWFCVEALLLNGLVDEGLQHLAGYDPSRAFDLLSVRHQHHQALRLLGWQDGTPLDKAWLETLPAHGGDDAAQVIHRLESALKVVRLLNHLGRRDEALEATRLLEDYSREQPDDNLSNALRKQCLQRVSQTWLSLGQPQRAWDTAAETVMHPDSPPLVLGRLYGTRGEDAHHWWHLLRRMYPHQSTDETFARVHAVMTPTDETDWDDFQRLVDVAVRLVDSRNVSSSDAQWAAIARACTARGMLETAYEAASRADESRMEMRTILAEVSWLMERWDKAAEHHDWLWQADHDRLADLALAAEALDRAGRQDEAQQRRQLAHQLAFDSRARFQMARGLHDRGLRDQAAEQYRILLRTAPPEHFQWNESARLLAEHLMATEPGAAADWLELSILDDLRVYFHLVHLPSYLRTPAMIHRLRAATAIDGGDIEAAERLALTAVEIVPAETEISEELVPRFEAAGHRDQADKLFEEQFRAHVRWSDAWPESAMLHNNLAWLAARCGRRLDDALRHAERGVELEPSAAHLDTLAEVHFRLGDRDRAIEYSKRAVALEPGSDTLRKQLQRFQAAP